MALGRLAGASFTGVLARRDKYWSVPYGDYPVTPDAPTGEWAHRVGAIPIANNVIPDQKLGRDRIGIMIHSGSASSLDALYTQGCFKVAPEEWPDVRKEILAEAQKGPLYLHVQPGGVASFTNTKTMEQGSLPTATAPGPPATSVASAASGGSSNHEQFIRDYAAKIGIDPDQAVAMAKAEGLNAWSKSNPNAGSYVDRTNGVPWSFGDFQLNTRNGMGVDALKAGVDPKDPNQWQAADRFALDQMRQHGVGAWSNPVAKQIAAGGGLTLNTPQAQGIVDPSIVARGGTSPPLDASGGTAVAAAPTFGESIAKGDVGGALRAALTKPPPKKDAQGNDIEQKSPLEKVGDAISSQGQQKQAPAIPEQQQAMAVQDPDPGLAPAAQQLFSTVQAAAAKPLTWTSTPYGSTAGLQRPLGPMGTTLNATGYGYG